MKTKPPFKALPYGECKFDLESLCLEEFCYINQEHKQWLQTWVFSIHTLI